MTRKVTGQPGIEPGTSPCPAEQSTTDLLPHDKSSHGFINILGVHNGTLFSAKLQWNLLITENANEIISVGNFILRKLKLIQMIFVNTQLRKLIQP